MLFFLELYYLLFRVTYQNWLFRFLSSFFQNRVSSDPEFGLQDVVRCQLCETPVPALHCDMCHVDLCKDCLSEHYSDRSIEHSVVPFALREGIYKWIIDELKYRKNERKIERLIRIFKNRLCHFRWSSTFQNFIRMGRALGSLQVCTELLLATILFHFKKKLVEVFFKYTHQHIIEYWLNSR